MCIVCYTTMQFPLLLLSTLFLENDYLNSFSSSVGKSLCFQIPALLTGKVVVVISPLISLMHDQCLKLAKHGVSACFLGSGQIDHTVEQKAMSGMYQIIYVCPETILRLFDHLWVYNLRLHIYQICQTNKRLLQTDKATSKPCRKSWNCFICN